jgi:hypothetical protein
MSIENCVRIRVCHHDVARGGDSFQIWRVAVNILMTSRVQLTKVGPPASWLGGWLKTLTLKEALRNVTQAFGFVDTRFGRWNVRSLQGRHSANSSKPTGKA